MNVNALPRLLAGACLAASLAVPGTALAAPADQDGTGEAVVLKTAQASGDTAANLDEATPERFRDTEDAVEEETGDAAEDEAPAGDESGSEGGAATDEGPAADDDGAADPDEGDEDPVPAGPGYTGWVGSHGEQTDAAHTVGWVDSGVRAESKFFYDPATDAWYWTEADGSLSRDHDAFVPLDNTVAGDAWENATTEWRMANGKWVRLGADGRMVKGEDYKGGEWYLFDEVTGAMQYGFRLLPDGQGGSKWVFYDYVTGQMAHGERAIDGSHGDEAGWMYFDPATGAVVYGWKDLSGKRVYYNEITGRMVYGSTVIGDKPYCFDQVTGALLSRDEMVSRLLSIAASQNGITDGYRYQNAAIDRGSSFNSMGPCTAYVWWCFDQAGLTCQFMNGAASTYPHEVRDWYAARGRFSPKGTYTPQPGDLWLTDNPTGRPFPEASATHCGIVDHVSSGGTYIYVWEHVNGYVHLVTERYDHGTLIGYARPWYNE